MTSVLIAISGTVHSQRPMSTLTIAHTSHQRPYRCDQIYNLCFDARRVGRTAETCVLDAAAPADCSCQLMYAYRCCTPDLSLRMRTFVLSIWARSIDWRIDILLARNRSSERIAIALTSRIETVGISAHLAHAFVVVCAQSRRFETYHRRAHPGRRTACCLSSMRSLVYGSVRCDKG